MSSDSGGELSLYGSSSDDDSRITCAIFTASGQPVFGNSLKH